MSEWKSVEGMSLLDYFAGQALVGIISNPSWSYGAWKESAMAYKAAEAMLAERERRGNER